MIDETGKPVRNLRCLRDVYLRLTKSGHLALALLFSWLFHIPAATAQTTPFPDADWPTATPESQGLDSTRLEQASRFIESSCPTRYSLLVVRNGRLVFERYYHGSNAAQANNSKSMAKSILSVLTGIAIQEGRIRGVDQKISEFFPQYFHDGLDPRKLDITLEHLLTMRAGFQWNENSPMVDALWTSPNLAQTLIEGPLTSTPGRVFNYNTGLTHMLSGILTRISGTTTLAYATSRLFTPLGITCYRWTRDPAGLYLGGSDIWLTARDFARFGLLVLRKGRWKDAQIVNEAWIRESTRVHARTGGSLGGDYGYLWWCKPMAGYRVFHAAGYGAQHIFLVPELDLMVVTTAYSDGAPPNEAWLQPYDILSRFILPAATGPAPSINPGGIVHASDYKPLLTAGYFASLFGRDLSLVAADWNDSMPADGQLPTSVAGVEVRVGGRSAPVFYAGPSQVNFLVPDLPAGRHTVEVQTARGSASAEIEIAETAPAWFVVPPKTVRAGDIIDLYASGLGPSNPPAPEGFALSGPLGLATMPQVFVAGREAAVQWAGLTYAGVAQLNIQVPAGTPLGEAQVELRAGGRASVVPAVMNIVQ